MPTAEEYEAGFKLKEGLVLANYKLTKMKIGHHQVARWNEYEYPSELTFEWTGTNTPSEQNMKALFATFTKHIAGLHIIRTESQRPYKCLFQYPPDTAPSTEHSADYKTVTLEYKGYGKRVGKAEAQRIISGQQTTWDGHTK